MHNAQEAQVKKLNKKKKGFYVDTENTQVTDPESCHRATLLFPTTFK